MNVKTTRPLYVKKKNKSVKIAKLGTLLGLLHVLTYTHVTLRMSSNDECIGSPLI